MSNAIPRETDCKYCGQTIPNEDYDRAQINRLLKGHAISCADCSPRWR